jgi:DNA-binding HxlR family transcriptional regulator
MGNSSKVKVHSEASGTFESPEIAEMKAIRTKLSEMHNDIKKVMEHSNRVTLESALESSRNEYSNVLLSHLFEDIDTGLDRNMAKKCPDNRNCRATFTTLLQNNAGLIKQKNVDETLVSKTRKQIEEMRTGASYSKCERCFSEVSSLFVKQVNLMRSMRIYEDNREQKLDLSTLETDTVINQVLEPVANNQRLEILKAVAFGTKSFSAFSELTGLRGGNLLFHLQKLTESGLILQQHERGDYMITEKGYKILKGLNDISSALQVPAEKLTSTEKIQAGKTST